MRYKHAVTSILIIKKKLEWHQFKQRNLCAQDLHVLSNFSYYLRPLKFLGPASRKYEEFALPLDANASFKENDHKKRRNSSKSKRKTPKCSLLEFL